MPTVDPDVQPSAAAAEARAVFAHLDFSQHPEPTALDQVLHELLAPTCSWAASGCLALLPVQTDLGKTHSSLGLLIEQMLEQVRRRLEDPSAAARLLIYIKGRKRNLVVDTPGLLLAVAVTAASCSPSRPPPTASSYCPSAGLSNEPTPGRTGAQAHHASRPPRARLRSLGLAC